MGMLDFCKAGGYPVYVLCILLITYLLNQLDRYILAIVILPLAQEIHFGDKSCLPNETRQPGPLQCNNASGDKHCYSLLNANGTPYCKWDYNGNGWEYQIMAGPIFILIYTFMGIFIGFLADAANRKNLLAVSLFFWSLMTFLMGFAQEYWHLVLLRFGQGIGYYFGICNQISIKDCCYFLAPDDFMCCNGVTYSKGSAHRYHPCAGSGAAKTNTHCPPKRVPSADRFFSLCRPDMQPPQSYSVGGPRSSGQLSGKPAGARTDYRGRWCALS
ncbi:UNVERIFIED_CONTAM: hypothetical protein FKN15_058972 [Acipenser sinensis]